MGTNYRFSCKLASAFTFCFPSNSSALHVPSLLKTDVRKMLLLLNVLCVFTFHWVAAQKQVRYSPLCAGVEDVTTDCSSKPYHGFTYPYSDSCCQYYKSCYAWESITEVKKYRPYKNIAVEIWIKLNIKIQSFILIPSLEAMSGWTGLQPLYRTMSWRL